MAVDTTLPQLFGWKLDNYDPVAGTVDVWSEWRYLTLGEKQYFVSVKPGEDIAGLQNTFTRAYDNAKTAIIALGYTLPAETAGTDRQGFDNDDDIVFPDP